MSKLSDRQLVLLSAATQRDDHVIAIGERLKGGVARSVGQKLLALGLAKECAIEDRALAWRTDDQNLAVALIITEHGLAAISLSDDPSTLSASRGLPSCSTIASAF